MNDVQFRGLMDFFKERDYHIGKDSHQLAYVKAMAEACTQAQRFDDGRIQSDADGSSISLFIDAEAGTGKTTLATLFGVFAVQNGLLDKILYLRTEDDVAGGKDRGALPGDDDEKNAPYKAAFIEAMDEAFPGLYEKWSRLEDERKQIQQFGRVNKVEIQKKAKAIATHPGHFRGKTRSKMLVIIDEAQNWRRSQLQAIYTRFKNNCIILTIGHSGQCDIPKGQQERVAGLLPFKVFAIHHQKRGAWVGTLLENYRGPFAQWSDKVDITIAELLAKEVKQHG